ncbi:hypothetical protein CPC08DRAFT_751256 [Agrocybe pediades]|nr:hypothetical protein CPC08DRAFT_751256 [Agrocybe pediades]
MSRVRVNKCVVHGVQSRQSWEADVVGEMRQRKVGILDEWTGGISKDGLVTALLSTSVWLEIEGVSNQTSSDIFLGVGHDNMEAELQRSQTVGQSTCSGSLAPEKRMPVPYPERGNKTQKSTQGHWEGGPNVIETRETKKTIRRETDRARNMDEK